MAKREARHERRELTPAEKERMREVRRVVLEEKDEILAKARHAKHAHDLTQAALDDAVDLLKSERLRQGLSLADVQDRTGIERANLSRLENEAEANPTIATLSRYAGALGKKLLVVLAD